VPVGPLRLLDAATGKARTLLDGNVVGFWWAPDGKTIAALRVQPVAGAAASPGTSAAPDPSASAPETEIRLLFVDVESGKIRSQPVVQPGQLFIDQFLLYFDSTRSATTSGRRTARRSSCRSSIGTARPGSRSSSQTTGPPSRSTARSGSGARDAVPPDQPAVTRTMFPSGSSTRHM
jgi:hypothetical protein